MSRPSGRAPNQLRPISIQRSFTKHAEGSVLVSFGDTKVICTASVDEKTPAWKKEKGGGWVTAEYGMLPRATHDRNRREAATGKQNGRTQEIQRLIGRSLRACVNLDILDGVQITLDCDVIQADGGTRTAAITGGYVALADSIGSLLKRGVIKKNPMLGQIAAISVGLCNGTPVLDLDYSEDSTAEADVNVVMNDASHFIEVQGTAEGHAFRREELDALLDLAAGGIRELMELQRKALAG